MLLCDNLVGHDSNARAGAQSRDTSAEPGQEAAPDDNVISASGERDLDHGRSTGANGDGHGWLLREIEK